MYRLFSPCASLGELSELGQTAKQAVAEEHRGQRRQAEALQELITREGSHGLPEHDDTPAVLTQRIVGLAEPILRDDLEREVLEGRGDGQGAKAGLDAAVVLSCPDERLTQVGRDLAQPALITDRLGQALRFVEVFEEPLDLTQRPQGVAQAEPEVDGLLLPISTLRQAA